MSAEPFGARLRSALDERGPLCVGIDPHPHLLAAWGLGDDPRGLEAFALGVVDALADRVAIFKPQSAFFERFGSAGVAVLETVIRRLREAGALVLLDGKRGDIGSTMAGYASAYLDPASPLASDALTVNPYLGMEALRPAVDLARDTGSGLFVLALTSNPGARRFQAARTEDGTTVAGAVLAALAELNAGYRGLGSFGAVVGATVGSTQERLDVNGPLLAPGLGAQGAAAADLREVFGAALPNVVPSMSREILAAGPDPGRLRRTTRTAIESLRQVIAP